jgi:hypothetical protein
MIMKNSSTLAVVLSLTATLLCFVTTPAVRRSAAQVGAPLAVIVGLTLHEKDISLALLRRVYRGEPTEFGGSRLVPYNYAPDHALRRAFDKAVLGMAPEQAGAYWVDRRIRGQGMPPRAVPAAPIMKAIVAKLAGAIGYVPADEVDGTVVVLTVDGVNFKAPNYQVK